MHNACIPITENKLIYLVLANVENKKKFFLIYEITITACLDLFHLNKDFDQKRKKRYIVLLFFLFFI